LETGFFETENKKLKHNKKMKTLSVIMLWLAAGSIAIAQTAPDPKDIMKKSRDQSKLSGMEARTVLEINDGKGNQRVRETTMASRIFPDGTEKRTILFQSPADVKGTGILIHDFESKDDNMWIYMPALRKSRKIVSSEKSKNFMGSEFSNADLAVGNIDDFTYTIEGTETVDQNPCWKIKALPVNPQVASDYGISAKIMWISQKDFMPRKTVFIDPDGNPWKEMAYTGIKLMDARTNKYFISSMEIRNLKNGRNSRMNMSQMTYNPSVKEELFTLSFIEKQ
jgi:outer membrane lipoprotein-sorting protein